MKLSASPALSGKNHHWRRQSNEYEQFDFINKIMEGKEHGQNEEEEENTTLSYGKRGRLKECQSEESEESTCESSRYNSANNSGLESDNVGNGAELAC